MSAITDSGFLCFNAFSQVADGGSKSYAATGYAIDCLNSNINNRSYSGSTSFSWVISYLAEFSNPDAVSLKRGRLVGIELSGALYGCASSASDRPYDYQATLEWNGVKIGNDLSHPSSSKYPTSGVWSANTDTWSWGGASELWGAGIQLSDLVHNLSLFGFAFQTRYYHCQTYIYNMRVKFHVDESAMLAAM